MKQTSEALLEFCLTTHYQGACEAITLKHPLLGDLPRRLVRGRTASLLGGSSPLPWTSAVRAFVALALRAALAKEHPTSSLSDPFAHGLSGGRGSHARSLDYAIAKKPAWILDLFGVSADDKPHVGRFFWRNNPEGKRGENVSVALNTKLFPASSIRFVVDNALVSCPEALQKLLAIIEGSFPTIIHATFARQAPGQLVASARPEKKDSLHELVVSLAKRELKHTLSATPVFSGTQLREAVSGITSHRLVQSLAGNAHSVLGSVYNWSSPTIRNGLNPSLDLLLKGYSHEKPLTVALSVVTIGSLVLFEYLKRHRNIPLELNYQFSTGGEVTRAVQDRVIEPDLCVGATPSAALMVARAKKIVYQPVMLMPKHTHAMLAPRDGPSQGRDYRFLLEEPSGAQFYFEELAARGYIQPSRIGVAHCDVDDALYSLAHGGKDLRCILWFPMYDIAATYCGAHLVDHNHRHLGENWIFLMAHQRLLRSKIILEMLLAELHGAWLDLREDDSLLDSVIRTVVNEPSYIKTLTRAHGFHKIKGASHGNSDAELATGDRLPHAINRS